jgi:hypothetical protein
LRLIDVRADDLAARAYASGQFQGDVTPTAANIEAQVPVFETEAIKQGRRARVHDAGEYP